MPATFYDDIIVLVACYFYPAAAVAVFVEEFPVAPPTLAELTEFEPCLAVKRPDFGAC